MANPVRWQCSTRRRCPLCSELRRMSWRALAVSTKAGASASAITGAINSLSMMSGLKSLTPEQIQAIATVPGQQTHSPTPTPVPTPTTQNGAQFYASYCASCHGSLASSSKKGRTATQITNAINTVGSMSSLKSLTSAQISAIASALAVTSPTPTPTPTSGIYPHSSAWYSAHRSYVKSNGTY